MARQFSLFLDFDNTMMGTESLAVPSLIARFNQLYRDKLGYDLTLEEFFQNFHGQGREKLCDAMTKHYGFPVEFSVLFDGREAAMANYFKEKGVEMAPNLYEALTALIARQPIQLAYVSNNIIQRGLAAMRNATNGKGHDLARLFGANFFETSSDKMKPDPDVYFRAIHHLDADPSYAAAVEDSVTGLKSAKAAGLMVFGYTGFAEDKAKLAATLQENGAVACFDDWADFPAMLEAYLAKAA